MEPRAHRGFTLIELVIVIVLASIVAGVTAVFIAGPVGGYVDQARRAELVDGAEMALRRMARDVRSAVPNSLRVHHDGATLEMLNSLEAARYRTAPPGGPAKRLQFNAPDDSFNVYGTLLPETQSATQYLVIYNLGAGGANAYALADVITPTGTTFSFSPDAGQWENETTVSLSAPFQFAYESPTQRVFFVDQPISYLCGGGTLRRHAGYAIGPPPDPAAGQVVTAQVVGCEFLYDAGTASRAGLVTLSLTVAKDGESINLLHQVHVNNAP